MEENYRNFGKINKRAFLLGIIVFGLAELLTGGSGSGGSIALRGITCLMFALCVYKGMQEDVILNPYYLFALTPLSLLMYSETLSSRYLQELSDSIWLLAVLNIFAFLIGLTITKPYWSITIGNWDPNSRTELPSEEVDVTRMSLHAVILCLIGVLPSIAGILGMAFPLSSVIGMFFYIGVAFAFRSKKKIIIILTLLLSILNFLNDFNKTRVLYLAFTIIVSLEAYYIESKRQRFKLIMGGIALIAFMIIVSFPLKTYMRAGGSVQSFFDNFNEISNSAFSYYDNTISFKGPSFLKMPYMYFVSSWNNLQYVVETQNTRTYGLWFFKPILGYLQLDGKFADMYSLNAYSSFNTFTFVTVLFKDFGYFGSIFGSWFLGFYVKKVYSLIGKDCSAFHVASFALVGLATLEMFFSNHFFTQSYPFTIVIVALLYKKVFRLEGY